MSNILIKQISIIRTDILSNYGNTAYQELSKDFDLNNVPKELFDLWYSHSNFSFENIKNINIIDNMTDNELDKYYNNVKLLHEKLKNEFNRIKEINKNG